LGGVRRAARLLIFSLAVLACAPAAHAAAPAWVESSVTADKTDYWQGMTDDGAGHLFFDGVTVGGYRTDLTLREQARNTNLIPPSEPFNHIGDWTYDHGADGRLILPLECYTPGAPNGGNTCGMGAFGVADPRTMTWQYRVLLDRADIAKAMWAEVSPDGQLIWTSSGSDLLAYATADVNPANAGEGTTIRPVRRLAGAVPPSGVTGAVFDGQRLLVAGQGGGPFEVWSIDLTTGARTLLISAKWFGESEGLDRVDALGGELHWQVMPLSFGHTPTFGNGHGTIVSFVRRADARIRLLVTRRTRTRVTVRASLRYLGRDHPLAGARLTAGRAHATTDKRGRAVLRRTRARLVARKPPLLSGRLTLR
jgi:hypothetical protein